MKREGHDGDRIEAMAGWLFRIFGPDVAAAHHEDAMGAGDWRDLAVSALEIADGAEDRSA